MEGCEPAAPVLDAAFFICMNSFIFLCMSAFKLLARGGSEPGRRAALIAPRGFEEADMVGAEVLDSLRKGGG